MINLYEFMESKIGPVKYCDRLFSQTKELGILINQTPTTGNQLISFYFVVCDIVGLLFIDLKDQKKLRQRWKEVNGCFKLSLTFC